MLSQFKNRNFIIVLCADLALFCVALILAYGIRFNFDIPGDEWRRLAGILPLVLSIKMLTFFLAGVYRSSYTSVADVECLSMASLGAMLLITAVFSIGSLLDGYPLSIFMADCIFTLFLCVGVRIGIRLLCMQLRPMPGRSIRLSRLSSARG